MSKIKYLLPLLMLTAAVANAQNFSYKAKVAQAPKDGFYRIQLTSALGAYAGTRFEDLRMMDNDGKETPFLLKKEEAYQSQTDFIQYPILEDNSESDWQTVVIENNNKSKIDRIIFEMKNAATDRMIRISGSNDKDKWYVVRDKFSFTAYGDGNESTIRKLISFPMSDYTYFKVEIRSGGKPPLNILKAGYSAEASKAPAFLQVSGLTFTRTDSNKKTYLHVTCNPANRIDKLKFHISAPAMFKRDGIISRPSLEYEEMSGSNSMTIPSKSRKGRYESTESFELNSETDRTIETTYLGGEKADDFLIEITNFDSEILKIDSISAFQLTTTLTAELKKDKSYFLYFGDSLLSAPAYDLVYFQNKIPADAAILPIGDIQPKSAVVKDEYNKSNDKMMVWIGLGVIAVILFFLTGSMMKKMGRES